MFKNGKSTIFKYAHCRKYAVNCFDVFAIFDIDNCHGGITNKDLGLWSRRSLLANVSVGVSVQLNALVVGDGSYILRPCGHDLHGPTIIRV